MNKKLALIATIVAASLTSNAVLAHGWDRDGWREHRHHGWRPAPVETVYYVAPRPVYVAPPAYYPPVVYAPAPVRYVYRPAYSGGDRVVGQVAGAVVGSVIGNAIGHGGLAPTAIGAVVGGVIGGNAMDW